MQDNVHPVTSERHAEGAWRPFESYAWAAGEVVVPLAGSEIARAASCMPVAFIRRGSGFQPVAVLGLEPGVSLFVNDAGQWMHGYIPAALRGRPFLLLPLPDGRKVLCVDEAAGGVAPMGSAGADSEPFFAPDGGLAPKVRKIMEFLTALEDSTALTERACAALQKHGVLVPWPVTLQADSGTRQVDGLFRVDEPALGALPDEQFLDLRVTGALAAAYAQLLSLQHFPLLGELARARQEARRRTVIPVTASGDLDLSFLASGDTLKFS